MMYVALVLVALVAFYHYVTRTHDYWKSRGVKHDKPLPLFGNNLRNYLTKKSVTQMAAEMYWKYPRERVVGYFRSSQPELVIRDPELAKQIIINDFAHFNSRGILQRVARQEPLLRNLFFADGDLWKLLRQRMTPAFTSGKLRGMFPLIVERAEKLQARALAAAEAGRALDARDMMARYTTDFIGACGFGLDADSLTDENSAFRQLGAKIFQFGPKDVFVAVLKELFPVTFRRLKYLTRLEKDVIDLVDAILKERNYKPCGRNDFIDLMLECKMKGTIVSESIEKINVDGTPERATLEMDDLLIAAQVFVFFAAGFETSSSATSFTLHQLAYNPGVQRKVQEEIDRVLAKHDNKLSYDSIKEMTYLECAFKEGMRMFPSLGFLKRECTKKYTFSDLGFSIDEGVAVMIPLQAMHNDPQYFEEPERFRPERFLPEEFDPKNKYVYMPFGDGPRVCIGARLGLMQSQAGLAAVLSRFHVAPAPETVKYPMVEPKSGVIQSIRGGLPLLFRERKPIPA